MKIQRFDEGKCATNNAGLFMKLFRHREIRSISNGNNITEVNII